MLGAEEARIKRGPAAALGSMPQRSTPMQPPCGGLAPRPVGGRWGHDSFAGVFPCLGFAAFMGHAA